MPRNPRGTIHHIDLSVADPRRSRPLYDLVMGHLGYRVVDVKADGGVEYDHETWTFLSIGVAKSKGPNAERAHDRYSPGLHHLAWAADTREDVDALHAKLVAFGATILDAPADYPQYNQGKGYYAVFFSDPDGLKLEYAWTP
jgi:catechol 2,3-dioxygenase-like lactoylglutathione lyase family enzyme